MRNQDSHLHAARVAHGLGGEVGVGTGAVPVTLDGLGVEGGDNAEVLTQPVQQPAGQVDLITQLQGANGANLVLPLTRHHLGVDTGDVQASLHAGLQVGLSQGTAEGRLRANTAVEGTLQESCMAT